MFDTYLVARLTKLSEFICDRRHRPAFIISDTNNNYLLFFFIDRNSDHIAKTGQLQQDLEATQAYATPFYQEKVKGEDKETQPLAALTDSNVYNAETQFIAQEQDKGNTNQVAMKVAGACESRGGTEDKNEVHVDSNLSTADTMLVVRSPRQEEETQPFVFLAALRQQEEREKMEMEIRHQVVNERTPEDESLELKEKILDGMEIMKEQCRDGLEHEKNEQQVRKERLKEDDVCEEQTQPVESEDSHVMIAETQSMSEDKEGQESQLQSDLGSSPGSSWKKYTAVVEPTQPLEVDDIDDVIAQAEDVHKQEQQNEVSCNMAHKRRRLAGEVEPTLPMFQEPTQPIEADFTDDDDAQDDDQQKESIFSKPYKIEQVSEVEPTLPIVQESTQPIEADFTDDISAQDASKHKEKSQMESSFAQDEAGTKDIKDKRRQVGEVVSILPRDQSIEASVIEDEEDHEDEQQPSTISKNISCKESAFAKLEPAQPSEVYNRVASTEIAGLNSTKTSPREEDRTLHNDAADSHAAIIVHHETCQEKPQVEVADVKRSHKGRRGLGTKDQQLINSVETHSTTAKDQLRQDEEQPAELGSSRSRRVRQAAKVEPAHPMKSCYNKEQKEEQEFKPSTTRRTARMTQIAKATLGAEDHSVIGEDKNRHEEEKSNEEWSKRRSLRRKENTKDEPRQPLDPDSEPPKIDVIEHEEEKEQLRKSQRGRATSSQAKAKATIKRESKRIKVKEQEESECDNKGVMVRAKGRRKEEGESKSCEHEEKARSENKDKSEKDQDHKDGLEQEGRGVREENESNQMLEEENKQEKRLIPEKVKYDQMGDKETQIKVKKDSEGIEKNTRKRKQKNENQMKEQELVTCENKTPDPEVETDVKPRRGRRTTRKLLAPPADDDVPAKRTRSRSSSSNSICSELSTSTLESQSGVRAKRKSGANVANEQNKSSCKTATVQSDENEKETHSRSSSRSQETSSSNDSTLNRRRGRKSIKIEEPETEKVGQHLVVVERQRGRGRARGGKHDVKSESASEIETEESVVVKESVVSRINSRGRKRGPDSSILTEETQQPTPLKTPRRSTAAQAYKVKENYRYCQII